MARRSASAPANAAFILGAAYAAVPVAWHAYLWDPWFLAWGSLVLVAVRRSAPPRVSAPATVRHRAVLE